VLKVLIAVDDLMIADLVEDSVVAAGYEAAGCVEPFAKPKSATGRSDENDARVAPSHRINAKPAVGAIGASIHSTAHLSE
jgi:hypothetical protein